MLYLITGGSGSGKSEYAERRIGELYERIGSGKKIYAATMIPYGEETKRKIARHQKMRAEKAFVTEECHTDLYGFAKRQMNGPEEPPFVLLECMSNLVANELFAGMEEEQNPAAAESGAEESGEAKSGAAAKSRFAESTGEDAAARVMQGIRLLLDVCRDVVVVTNEVCSESTEDTPEMRKYKQVLGSVNRRMAELAAEVTEVVCGIPLVLKGKKVESASVCKSERKPGKDADRDAERDAEEDEERDAEEDTGRDEERDAEKDAEREKGMKLIVGGAFQGKLEYGKKLYPGIRWIDGAECAFERIFTCEGMYHFETYIRRLMCREQDGNTTAGSGSTPGQGMLLSGSTPGQGMLLSEQLPELLPEKNPGVVLIGCEIGSGLVPVDAFERAYREKYGRICTGLAQQAVRVDRVVCGIGRKIKEDGRTEKK